MDENKRDVIYIVNTSLVLCHRESTGDTYRLYDNRIWSLLSLMSLGTCYGCLMYNDNPSELTK